MAPLSEIYSWTSKPVVVGAPMRQIALAKLAVEISAAGGIGFIGAGNALDQLDGWLQEAANLVKAKPNLAAYYEKTGILPVGFGFFNWAPTAELEKVIAAVKKWKPIAVWQFGAHEIADYSLWGERIRQAGEGKTQVWVQVGSVSDAGKVSREARPDVIVVQGTDAGGHGLTVGAGIASLLPEVVDDLQSSGQTHIALVAAGGIVDARGTAAALTLGADAVCLGTRFLASEEAVITDGYRNEIVRASDGGANTRRTKVYDQLRGTIDWPLSYNARGVLNKSFYDHEAGMSLDKNKTLYDAAMKAGNSGWGVEGRITTYAGTAVGLVKSTMKASDIVRKIQSETQQVLQRTQERL